MRHPFLKWEGGQIHTHPPPPDLCTLDSCDNMPLSPLIWILVKNDGRHFWTASAEPAGSLHMRSPAVCCLWRGGDDQCLLVSPWWSESWRGVCLSGSSASLHSSKVSVLCWPLLRRRCDWCYCLHIYIYTLQDIAQSSLAGSEAALLALKMHGKAVSVLKCPNVCYFKHVWV